DDLPDRAGDGNHARHRYANRKDTSVTPRIAWRVGRVSRAGRIGSLLTLLTLLTSALHAQAARRSMGLTMQGQGDKIIITQVDDGGPADRAGLKPGDVIQSVAGITVARLDPKVLR